MVGLKSLSLKLGEFLVLDELLCQFFGIASGIERLERVLKLREVVGRHQFGVGK